ncbi:MAG TPA: CHRD domain-containing protein [Ktedonosporobacter sp.]|jgi:hypothetical protein|nr:CHRD domain-containing protein [Ktedonosporobacter sp.]
MRNCLLYNKSSIIRGSIIVVLLLTLFTMMSFTALANDQQRSSLHASTMTALQNAPSGTAALSWNSQNKMLTVTLHLSGLQPGSNHAAHIHAGTCSSIGKILYPLKNVVADAAGNSTSITTINNIAGGIPATGWNVAVHQGPTVQTGELFCGNIVNAKRAASVSVPLKAAHPVH